MPTCHLHPEVDAASACEYCGQPHCASCLQPFLGRFYCPFCLERVRAIATIDPPASPTSSPGPPGSSAPPPARSSPGWLSAFLYAIGFLLIVKVGAEAVLALPLLYLRLRAGFYAAGRMPGIEDLLDPSGIGVPLWCLAWGVFTWGSLLTTLIYTYLVSRFVERRGLGELGLRWRRTLGRDLIAGLVLAALLFSSVVGLGAARNWYSIHLAASPGEIPLILLAGLLILLPYAAVEEIAVRGYLLQSLRRSWGTPGAVIVSSALFAGLHAFNPGFEKHPLAFLGLLLAGVYLSSAYLITGSLWLPIFLHTGWNLMEGPVFGLPVSGLSLPITVFRTSGGGPALWTGGSFGPEAGLLLCLLMVVHLAALWSMRPVLRGPAQAPSHPRVYRAIPLSDRLDPS